MNKSVFENIGLSNNEISVFMALLKLGESKAGEIITSTGLQSSAVYNAVHGLIDKGFVSYIKKSDVKYYKSVDPEAILEYIDGKKREYEKMLPELRDLQKKGEDEGVEFFKSYSGIKRMIFEMMKEGKKGDIYRFFSVPNSEKYEKVMNDVYVAVKHMRKEKKVETRGLYNESVRKLTKPTKETQKRFVNFPLPPNMEIFQDKVAIISWEGEEPKGILIKSKDIAKTYADFFDHLWKIAKR